MILMISSQGNSVNSKPNPRFGRTPWFIKYHTADGTWTAVENPAMNEPGGAGVAAAQCLIDQTTEVAISGRFGPNASRALQAAGIKCYVFDNESESVNKVIEQFSAGQLKESR